MHVAKTLTSSALDDQSFPCTIVLLSNVILKLNAEVLLLLPN
jgi:hypothetical protein